MNQIINMIMRLFLRKVINRGIDKGLDTASGVGRKSKVPDADPAVTAAQQAEAKKAAQRNKQAMRAARRISQF